MNSSHIAHSLRLIATVVAAVAAFLLALTLAAAAQSSETTSEIRAILAAGSLPSGESVDVVSLRAFYAQRSYRPAWSANARARYEARQLLAGLRHADDDGLEPTDYRVAALLLRTSALPSGAAEYDLLLSDAALRFARDLRAGRPPLKSLDRDVDLPRQTFDAVASLNGALESDKLASFLATLPPAYSEYAALKRALAQYREIAAHGDWPVIPKSFPHDPESNADSAAVLRHRLALEDETAATSRWVSDSLKQFQLRHGLPADGRANHSTMAALNVSAAERTMQIIANMERWRWLPRALEANYVAVNVPDQHLSVVVPNGVMLDSRVIVGRPSDPTPIFRAVARSITVNPPWNVPSRIASREILPKLRKNPSYLLDHDMILRDGPAGDPYGLRINWRTLPAGAFRYHIQQRPGPKNALGTLKLELPNRFNVYLHYTSAQSLFALDSRALSHGCVRVEQILPLASYALSGNPAAAVSSLQSAIASGATEHLALKNPLPIYFLYWTAFPDRDGGIEFRPDIYGRDRRMIAAIENRAAAQRVAMNTVECAPG